jgi:citronellyl-CoA dehydrogenase
MGNRCSDTAQIFFENVRVPQANLIGEAGMGFIYQMEQFQEERLWSAASSQFVTQSNQTSSRLDITK